MRKLLFATAALVCLSGCHSKQSPKFLEFTLEPNASAKSVTVQCVGSSSGKCGFVFTTGTPNTALLETGGSVTIAGVEPGSMYCSGSRQPSIDNCRKVALPDKKATVRKEASAPASSSN